MSFHGYVIVLGNCVMNLVYHPDKIAPDVARLLAELAEEYPLAVTGPGLQLEFVRLEEVERLQVTRTPAGLRIAYGRLAAAARGVGYALAATEADEQMDFSTYAVLFDCSRNPVLTVTHARHWLRRLALLGYNMLMLYTKDAYQLPGETYFGYMRGAYSQDEIRAMDATAQALGIEMIASIQTLGHLEPVLRWPAYAGVRDTDNVVLVDQPETYALLEKMLAFWSGALSSRRIHIGMDETHDLGRGRFMDRFGHADAFTLYNRHLGRVCAICRNHGLQPMLWSDMYFRLGNPERNYYDLKTPIPDAVKAAIDPQARLVYWDYYHTETDFYQKMLEKHRGLGQGDPIMASGIWTWVRLWYDHRQTVRTVRPCLQACRAAGVRELIFTMWGDDGGYCDFNSAFAGLAWAADEAGNGTADDDRIEKLFAAIFGTSYRRQLLAGDLNVTITRSDLDDERRKLHGDPPWSLPAPPVLWDDPLMGIVWHEYQALYSRVWEEYAEHLAGVLAALTPHRLNDRQAGDIGHAWNSAQVLWRKVTFRLELVEAYRRRDRVALEALRGAKTDAVISALDALNDSFRRQWFRCYKSYGLEVMQIKLAGLKERYRETARRLDDLLNDRTDAIPELDLHPRALGRADGRYRMTATGGWFI